MKIATPMMGSQYFCRKDFSAGGGAGRPVEVSIVGGEMRWILDEERVSGLRGGYLRGLALFPWIKPESVKVWRENCQEICSDFLGIGR